MGFANHRFVTHLHCYIISAIRQCPTSEALRVGGYHRGAKSLIRSLILLLCGHSENLMAYLRSAYAVCALMIFVFLVSGCFGQTHPFLRVDEQQIKFRLDSHPVLE